jgi:hypothetical protein
MTVMVDHKNPNTFKFSVKTTHTIPHNLNNIHQFFKHTTTSCSKHSDKQKTQELHV